MDKDAYYFSHDSNAFHDPKIIKLRSKHGLEGYGFYWAFIEHLRNQPNYILLLEDLDLLAFHLNSDESKIKQMLNTCLSIGLLISENGKVFSDSLLRRMIKVDKIRKKRSDAGKMGGRPKANGKQNESKTKALKEKKEKESKENKTKEEDKKVNQKDSNDLLIFENFRKSYPGIKKGLETEFSNFKKKHKDWKEVLPELLPLLKCQINERTVLKSAGQFVPEWKHLSTWINQRCWEEEFTTEIKPEITKSGWGIQ